jgi:multidrug resistance efflux pump
VKRFVAIVLVAACNQGTAELALVEVKRADLVVGVEVLGELAAVDSLDVKPPALADVWDFKIAQLVTEGIEVKPGEPLVAFDTSEQMQLLETMQNDADAAKKKLEKKREDAALARRDEELQIAEAEARVRKAALKVTTPGDLVASVDQKVLELDEQSSELQLQQVRNKAAKAAKSDAAELEKLADHQAYLLERVAEIKQNIAKMNVTSPRSGTVVFPTSWRGEKKKVGDGVHRMEPVVQVVGLGKMQGNGQIDEIDFASVRVAQPVAVQLDALPDVRLRGSVQSIAKSVGPKSHTDPSNVIKVKLSIDSADGVPLRPGMRFRAEVETERIANVVLVPADAVFVTPEGPVAYRATGDGGVSRVKLAVGKRNATAIEVKAGLAPGDRVSRIDPDRSSR